ncbi:hypothetical protein LCGC14_1113250 [marine sediment metagenome]|uniref:Sulfotransferase domain-containing protein n=1 Tax=marine sediment metagenome TaxID=412755 RepID=A0A0F9MAW1_9ZZZZ
MSQSKTICPICGIEYPEHDQHEETDVRFIATTFPKTGTNLLIQLLGNPRHILISHEMTHLGVPVRSGSTNPDVSGDELTYREVVRSLETFVGTAFGHVPFNQLFFTAMKKHPTVIAFLVRDPRDTIVSHVYHASKVADASMNYLMDDDIMLNKRPDPIMDLIKISPERWRLFMPWMDRADMIVRFEEMIEDRIEVSQRLIDSVKPHSVAVFKTDHPSKMAGRVRPTISPTFRKGITSEWRTHFTDKHMAEYAKRMGFIHRSLGYVLE